MEQSLAEKISANPDYQRLKSTRSRFGWSLTLAMLVVYYGYILLIAFDKVDTQYTCAGASAAIGVGFSIA